MALHAAFGGSTNLLLHIPAIAHAARLPRPTVQDWVAVNRKTPRLVDALPNGPVGHPTVQVFLAGGVPEVMLHLRNLNLLHLDCLTVTGEPLEKVLDWWESSERRLRFREFLYAQDHVNPDDVIMSPQRARERGLAPTLSFPGGNLAPQGSVIKSTAIDPSLLSADGTYRHTGPARVFTTERAAIAAIKNNTIKPNDILVLICRGPLGAGMEETYQLTSALKHLPHGKHIPVLTDARFSGVSTGPCIGHVAPEALANGPLGKLQDGDRVQITVDPKNLTGSLDFVGPADRPLTPAAGAELLRCRPPRPDLSADPNLPDDTRLWALLQSASGGAWGGCVYDADALARHLNPKH